MKKLLTIIIILGAGVTLLAQEKDIRVLADFTKVDVGQAIRLTLVPGSKNEAEVKAGANISLQDVETEVRGSRLRIKILGSHQGSTRVTITLTYKSLSGLTISSAASVTTRGPIKADELEVEVTSAADARLEVEVKQLDVEVSSAADLTLHGKAVAQRVSVASAGKYDGDELTCEKVNVKVSSAGSARVSSHKELEAEANSGGTIKYRGNPEQVYVNTSSGGNIEKIN